MYVSAQTMNDTDPHAPPKAGEVDQVYHQMFRTVADLKSMVARYRKAAEALTAAHQMTLVRLAQAVEFKDGDTGAHIIRIGHLAAQLGQHLGLSFKECQLLCRAAPMHDIGKIGVPDDILKKPGPLTDVEWQIMRLHPELGARLLYRDDGEIFKMAAEIALGHHEKWDGSGYPKQLAGEAIPLTARIVGLIDYFDALTMDRCYRKALPDELVFEMVEEQLGKHFDPHIANVFLVNYEEFTTLRDALNRQYSHLHEIDLNPDQFEFSPASMTGEKDFKA